MTGAGVPYVRAVRTALQYTLLEFNLQPAEDKFLLDLLGGVTTGGVNGCDPTGQTLAWLAQKCQKCP